MRYTRWIICLALPAALVFCTGCPTVPVYFLTTHASGEVRDQFGRPVPHARMLATWRPHDLSLVHAKRYKREFKADADGHWEFGVRNASDLCVEALPSPGYATIDISQSLYGPVRPGAYWVARRPLRLRKVK